jgi:hypothetical protein
MQSASQSIQNAPNQMFVAQVQSCCVKQAGRRLHARENGHCFLCYQILPTGCADGCELHAERHTFKVLTLAIHALSSPGEEV